MKAAPRVYVDTSVVGGCADPEFKEWSLRLFEDFASGKLMPVVSVITDMEIAAAPASVRTKYEELLELEPEILDVTEQALQLTEKYIADGAVGANLRNDALHIAVATIAEVDVLVSWNFRHIVNYRRICSFNLINAQSGYPALQIYSPREVASS